MTENTPATPVAPPNVFNGTYTVSHPDRGHFTLKVYTAQKGDLAGKRIVALLTGPDNTSNYTGVAFWNDEQRRAYVWRRFKGAEDIILDGTQWARGRGEGYGLDAPGLSSVQKKLAIWADLVNRGERGFWYGEGYRVDLSGRCVVCNRELTDPESIRTGIGPKCGGRS